MDAVTVVVKLNPQQRELLDNTIASGAAPDLEALIRRALREHAAGCGGSAQHAPSGSIE
jgi:hypothetical protein